MKPLRVYLDTSVFGGCFDARFAVASRRVFDAAVAGKLVVLVRELATAPRAVTDVLTVLPPDATQTVMVTSEVIELQRAYLAAGVVSARSSEDAAHVAVATVARADAIVSWNFKHIVRLDRIRAYNRVNLLSGYGVLTIVSPMEVQLDDDDS